MYELLRHVNGRSLIGAEYQKRTTVDVEISTNVKIAPLFVLRGDSPIDGPVMLVGVCSLLKQVHSITVTHKSCELP